MKKLIFVGLVVLLGTACTSSGGFDGLAHSVGGSTAGMVAKAVDGEISPGFPGNPVEVTPRTPDNGEPSSPIDKTPETPDEDRDGGWNTPTDDAPDWGVKPKNPKPEQPIEDDKNPGDIVDGDWGQERPSDNPPGDDDNGQGGGDGNGGQGGQNGGGSGQGGHGGAQIDDRMERDSSGGIGGGQGNRSSTDNRMERQPERPTAGRPSDNREANRRDRDHSRDRNGNATGRSVDGRGRVEHF